jgi:7-carboxy-7-deazaguanine synthase
MNINISELFFSLQGEGVSLGRRAVFIRVPKCNLRCGFGPKGSSSWTCDTQEVMKTSTSMSVEGLVENMKQLGEGVYESVLLGFTHVVITGGEPALEEYREPLIALMKLVTEESLTYQKEVVKAPIGVPIFEIETNGTECTGTYRFYEQFNFVNCSPKLSNSGMHKDKRIVPFALLEISQHPYSTFKFVISKESDWDEIKTDFLDTRYVSVPADRIFLMPAGSTREELVETSRVVWDICKKYGVLATTRLQVLAWDNQKGV